MSTDLEKKAHAKPKENFKFTKKGKIAIAITVVALVVLVSTLAMLTSVPADTIINGVYVGDLSLGGMTQAEAATAISTHNFSSDRSAFSISAGGNSREIAYTDVDLAIDSQKIAQDAFAVGHTENKTSNAIQAFTLKFSKKNLPVSHTVDPMKLDAILVEFGNEIYGQLKQHEVSIADDYNYVIVTPGTSGCSSNVESARNDVLKSISNLNFDNIKVSLSKEAPHALDVDTLAQDIQRDARDAYYTVENGEAVVVPDVVGITLDKDDARTKINSISEGSDSVSIRVIQNQPSVKTDALKAKLFNTTLADYTTKYNAGAVNRSKNVALATSKINNYVLAPGDVFSYNDVVGHRTAANGFFNAPVYENGKSVDGIGGGVCQVSTTLYSAVLYADLEIVSRQNHSLPVSYVPLGQDATVVDNSIDFQFKNNTDYPIKISASAVKGVLTVSILGTKPDVERTVKLSHKTVSTIPATSKETQDPSLPAGQRVVTSKGKTGYVVSSTKSVYENGVLVRTDKLGNSRYKMVPEEVNVGTGVATAVPNTTDPAAVTDLNSAPVETAPNQNPTAEVPPTDVQSAENPSNTAANTATNAGTTTSTDSAAN